MKKMTKWLAVCAVCVMGSVPAMAAEVPDVTVTPIPIETPAPDVTPIETPAPTPIPEVKNGWYEYGTKNKKYFKDGQYLTGMRKIHGEVYYFSPKGFMKTGWIKYNNKKYYFGSNGIRYSGVKKISGKYYYFSDKGVLRTKTVKVGNTTYYCTEKGILEAWKKGKTIYYPNGKKMNSTKAYEYETLQRAKDVVSKITKPSMSKSEKFETCFRWVMYQHYYDTRRTFYNQTAWPALYANDYLILSGKGGDCFSDACSFAYLAKALGYKNVYVCVDTTATDGSGHCWAEIVNDQHMILCREELFGDDDVVDLFVGEGLDLGLVVIVVQIDAHRLFGEHHRHIELACHHGCNADAAGLDGEHLVDGLAGKQALPLLCHFTEQRNIHLVVDKAVYLEHVALAYNTILADTFFQHLHSEPVPPSLFSISVHFPAHMFFYFI